MKSRIVEALKNEQVKKFVNNQYLFGIFLKGGYEDLFSKQLYNLGFSSNKDLSPQYELKDGSSLDIAQVVNDEIVSFVEFGHQFSLQFKYNKSALQKIKTDANKRVQTETINGNMYNVQIITDIININLDETCQEYFTNRYRIRNSIENRQNAIDKINSIKNTVDEFNINHGIPIGELVKLEIENNAGHIILNCLVNGPYSYQMRLTEL